MIRFSAGDDTFGDAAWSIFAFMEARKNIPTQGKAEHRQQPEASAQKPDTTAQMVATFWLRLFRAGTCQPDSGKWAKGVEVMAALVGLVLFYAAVSKMLEIRVFWAQLQRQPFPDWLAYVLVWLLPAAELVVCYALAHPRIRRMGLISAAMIMSVFTIYVGLGITGAFGEIPCVCGGLLGHLMDWRTHFVFNLIVLAFAVVGVMLDLKKGGSSRKVDTKAISGS